MQIAEIDVHVETWQQFRDALPGGTSRVPWATIWRGQGDSRWGLRSSFDRLYSKFEEYHAQNRRKDDQLPDPDTANRCYRDMRDSYLSAFKSYSSGLRGADPAVLDTDQWWALGRHYGLRTPLLDWSDRPFIGVFFAVTNLMKRLERNVGDLGSIQFSGESCAVYRVEICDPVEALAAEGFRIIRPQCEELSRMHNQRSLFTWLDSSSHRDMESFFEERSALTYLTKFIIPDRVAIEAYRDLHNFGIDWRVVYPDLEGAALAANEAREMPDDLWDLKY